MAAAPVIDRPPAGLRRRLMWLAGPTLLLVICCGFYWRLILSSEYTWLDSPDMAHQEAPRFQFEATRWHQGAFPLWDPHQWCGQPFLGQVVGAANPLNWLFFLLPLDDHGKVPFSVFHWYFVAIHFLGGLFAYWLCRDIRLSRVASLAGGVVFALNGFFGSNTWVGIMGGFVWAPLVFLFLLRLLRGWRPRASAGICGLFLGASWLSGHHEVPIYLSLTVTGLWLYHLAISDPPGRRQLLRLAAIAGIIAILTSGLQTVPGYEYAGLAQRWVGADRALNWNDAVPYSVDTMYSFRPGSLLGLVVPWLVNDANGYLGIVALSLAVLGVVTGWRERWVRLFTAVALFGLLFSLGAYNVFHGILYAVVPLFGKARVPGRLLSMFDFAAAPLAAYGLDALLSRKGTLSVRRIAFALAAVGGGLYVIALATGAIHKFDPFESVMFAGLVALLLAGALLAWQKDAVSPRFLAVAVLGLMMIEFGMVTGAFAERSGKGLGAYAGKLTAYEDIARFLKRQPGLVRVDFDDAFNFGDWEGIDALKGFGASVTSNILQLDWAAPRTQDLLGVTYTIAHAPGRPEQELVFQGSSGFNVYRNPGAFPRVWTVHRAVTMSSAANVRIALADPHFDDRATAPTLDAAPVLETCDGSDNAWMTARSAGSLSIAAQMGCRGMVVVADTWYPGWYATVDGKPASIYKPYMALRGIVVERGAHTIGLRYRPVSATLGAWMTLAGILSVCLLVVGLPGRWLAVACICLVVSRGAFAQSATAAPIKTTLCEIVKHTDRYDGKLVQFRATVESGVMDLPSGVTDETCSAELPFFTPDDQHLAALLKNREFQKLQKDLKKTPLVQATITGKFEHLPTQKQDSRLVLVSVEAVSAKRIKPAAGHHPA